MNHAKRERSFLQGLLFLSAGALPFLMRKRPRSDWAFAYFFNALSNVLLDRYLVKTGKVSYPVRLLPRQFSIHILFDLVLYPTVTVIYNQMTRKDKLSAWFYKVLLFSVPLTIVEAWANRRTGLIRWGGGWRWYHTLGSVTLKSLVTRTAVETYRRLRQRRGLARLTGGTGSNQ
ncbi:CBO0543 family protein [Paenibacillus sp.]|uniref:CBO0543 family protein n=1 Tax=Paenibacillus sp. TaxID=58172 RepID=UPI002D30E43A|nr:CBO0543 family protein [Paenibacillus sp.]HZG58109.1 CBO0543 family protein [Paenibacillus sp.]